MCLHMIRDNGINHFKLDGTSGEETQLPGSRFASDFEAVIHLLGELRDERPDLFINLTTGTWASPFWFGIADSVWRGGWDHEFIGEGTMRQKWMTFRDSRIFNNNVAVSPLFPINSLMNHGIIYTRKARGLDTVEGTDLEDEIWSAFGSGTQMQEIYMTPQLLEPSQWDTLARAAIWAGRTMKRWWTYTGWAAVPWNYRCTAGPHGLRSRGFSPSATLPRNGAPGALIPVPSLNCPRKHRAAIPPLRPMESGSPSPDSAPEKSSEWSWNHSR